jgi:hypothetical protein
MLGVICKRDIFAHPVVTIQCFGWKVFFRCLVAGRDETFLGILAKVTLAPMPRIAVPELVGRCVELELCAMRLFEGLAARFADLPAVHEFFTTLAQQEKGHSELLDLCRITAERSRWVEEQFAPWRAAIPWLEARMRDLASSVESVQIVPQALKLVTEIESSEVNEVFDGVVRATDSSFVRAMKAFWSAEEEHIAYICQTIPQLEPGLVDECRSLGEKWGVPEGV